MLGYISCLMMEGGSSQCQMSHFWRVLSSGFYPRFDSSGRDCRLQNLNFAHVGKGVKSNFLSSSENFPVTGKTNIAIFFTVLPVTWYLLWVASHSSLIWMFLAALAFALLHNTLFCLLHEAAHNIFSTNRFINDLFGVFCAATFPTSFTLQKISHLGHHKRNRTDKELYDYCLPSESKTLRNIWMYGGNLFGLYWFIIPLGNLLILIAPKIFTSDWFVQGPAKILGFESYLEEIARYSIKRIWLESLLALMYQIALCYFLGLSWQGWLLCHWFFALHWSALQYVDHAWSPRDVINGAWNLKVLPVSQLLALNFHLHLAHHRYPQLPWIYLPEFIDRNEPNPTFWSIYKTLWHGVRPAPPMFSPAQFPFHDKSS